MHNDHVRALSLRRVALTTAIAILIATHSASAQARSRPARKLPPADWTQVEEALGRKGTLNPGDVIKFGFPRTDLKVMVTGITLRPALALGSWVAFERIADHAMVMGDLVLLEAEVAPVMGSLQQNGIEQTALHNHSLGESSRIMYMHIHAIGNAARIARAVRTALAWASDAES
jgi:hypothetical protein